MFSRFPLAIAILCAVLLLCAPGPDCFASRKVTLTVYNQDLAFIRDRREVSLKKGVNDVSFAGVPSRVDPTSVRVMFPEKKAGARVLAQSYRYDVAELDRLLEIGLGGRAVVSTEGGEVFRGALIGYDGNSLILRGEPESGGRGSAGLVALIRGKVTDIRFPDLGKDLVVRPTLMWRVEADRDASTGLEASYLTSGMTWHAEYVAAMAGDGDPMELAAWATIDNKSGAGFADAALTLVAGQVHRAARPAPRRMEMTVAAEAPPALEEKGFFEYHAYTLDGTLTVRNNESVQLPLFEPAEVRIDRIYTYDPTRSPAGVKVTVKTENTDENGLGHPMPPGKVRVYAGEGEAGERLVGEDMLRGAPVGSEIELTLGVAFDVKGERKRTAFTRFGRNSYEESYEIKLRNSKSVPVEVVVIEHPHGDWNITKTSLDFEKVDSDTVRWRLAVPPSGEATISYTIQFGS